MRFAKLLGASNITGDTTEDILRQINTRLTQEGLTFGLHNHFFPYMFAYESPEDVLKCVIVVVEDDGRYCGYWSLRLLWI